MQLRNRLVQNVVATNEGDTQRERVNIFDDEPLKERMVSYITSVYTSLGCGRRESVYQRALQYKLCQQNFNVLSEYPVPLMFEQKKVGCAYLDLLLPDKFFIEVKANSKVSIRDVLQCKAYSRETSLPGFLVNFTQQLNSEMPPEIFLLEENRSQTLSRTTHTIVLP